MASRSRVTIRDVAELVGVHPSTVSRVLNPATRGRITSEIVAKVNEAAAELGYRPNQTARGLRTNRTQTIGVLIPDITNPLFPPIIRGIEDGLGANGYTAILGNTDNIATRETEAVATMRARQVDGLILATARRDDPIIAECIAEGLPLVLVNRSADTDGVSSIVNDDALGIALAVRHLKSLGHTHIAHIAGPRSLSTGEARRRSFLEAMKSEGLDADEALIAETTAFSEDEGLRACAELISKNLKFTAIVAANDLIALGAYEAIADAGLTCPDDISVTGFNDMPFVDRLTPPLTTVRIPHYELGREAGRRLVELIETPDSPARATMLRPELIVRGSTSTV
ncbi:MAG: LacI family DNA-binding transcriptional regulator [Rhodospirillaceae bacterium]|nr:LacI family DNA-binding transcriptional regulator [Rhodospirillaceae bacterium]